jgi:fibronectin-binding autotransporter adhesin
MHKTMRFSSLMLGLVLALQTLSVRAATFTWDGALGGTTFDSSGTWNATTANWWSGSADVAWTSGGTAQFGFGTGGTNPYTVTVSGSQTVGGILFQNQIYTLNSSGGSLYLGAGGITANSPATIAVPVTVGAAQTWTNNSSGLFTVSGNIATGANLLTIGGSGNTSLSGTINGSAGMTKSGSGILTLSGSNGATGNVTVSAGMFNVASGGSLNNATNIYVNSAVFAITGGLVTTSSDTFAGFSSAGTITVSGGTLNVVKNLGIGNAGGTGVFNQTGGFVTGSLPVNLAFGTTALGGTMNLSGGTVSLGAAAPLFVGYGSSSAFNISGSAYANIASFNMGRGTSHSSSSIFNYLNLNGGTLGTNSVISVPGTGPDNNIVNFNGGLLQATASSSTFLTGMTSTNVLAGGAVIDSNGYAITIAQPLLYGLSGGSLDGGLTVLSSTGAGVLTLTGSNTFNGPTAVNGGTLALGPAAALASTTINVAAGGNFTAAAGSTIPGTLTLGASGTVNFSSSAETIINALNGPSTASIGLLGGTTLTATNGGAFAGTFLDNGTGGSLILGGSRMTLSGNNVYGGGTTFSGGTLQVGAGGNSGSLGTGNVAFNGLLVFNRSDTGAAALVVPAAISGSGSVVLAGSGSVTLSGYNSYLGTTAVNAGTLIVNGTHTGGAAYTVAGGATLAGSGTISGANSVTLSPGANLAPGSNVTTGGVGTLTLPSLSIAGGGTVYFDLSSSINGGNDLVQVNGPLTLSGSTSVVVNPTNVVLASGDYPLFDYTGVLTHSSSSLVLAPGALSSRQTAHFDYTTTPGEVLLDVVGVPANLVWAGGTHGGFTNTWNQNVTSNTAWSGGNYFSVGDSVTFDATSGANTTVTVSGAVSPSAITVTGANSYVFTGGGQIGGASALSVQGPGSLTIANSGGNNYSGGTYVQGGTVVLGLTNALPTGGTLTLGSASGNGLLDLAGHNQQLAGLATDPSATTANQIIGNSAVSSTSTLTFNGPGSPGSYFGGTIQDGINGSGGKLALTVAGGLLNLSGSNTYSGPTTIASAGTLQLGSPTALYAGAATNNAAVNGTLDLAGYNAGVNALSGSGVIACSSGGATLTVGNNNATSTFAGSFQNTTLSLTKAGSGSLVLTGQSTNNVSNTLVNQGVLQVANNNALGVGTYTLNPGTNLYLNYAAAVTPNWANFSGSGTLELNSAQAVAGLANWCVSGSLNLSSALVGTLQVDNGRVQGGPANLGGAASVVINNGAQFLAYDATTNFFAYVFNQNFSINGMGWGESGENFGALRVSGMNATFTGNITLTGSSGIFTQGNSPSEMNVSGTISGPYPLAIYDNYTTYPITLSGSNTYTGTTTVGAGHVDLANSGALLNSTLTTGGIIFDAAVYNQGQGFTFGGLSGSGAIALTDNGSNAVALSVGNNNSSTTYSGALSGLGSLTWNGTGMLTLSGTSTYAGGTTISAGTLQVGNFGKSGSLGSGTIVNNNVLLISRSDSGPASLVIPGNISGSGALIVNGGGVVTLAGSNSYAGATAVNAGTLIVNGSHVGGGAYTIFSGATLAGSGTISSASSVTLAAGANLAPGNNATTGSAGTLTLPGLSLAGGGTAYFDLSNSTSGNNDLVQVNGPLTLNGSTTVVVNATNNLLAAGAYPLFSYTGAISYSSSATALMLPAGSLSPRQTAYFDYSTMEGVVALDIMGGPLSLTWAGGTQGGFTNTWNQNVTANSVWNGGNYFAVGDNVTFDATAGTNSTVNLSGTVNPTSLTVTGSNAYTFTGSGSIGGGASLVMNGPGSLTLNTSDSFSGGTALAGGLLNLGNSAALGSGPLSISGGSLNNTSGVAITLAGNNAQNWNGSFAFLGSSPLNTGSGAVTLGAAPTVTVSGGTLTVNGPISGAGYALTKNGSGTLVLVGSNSFTNGTSLSNGVLVMNNNSALGSGMLTINGGTLDSSASGITLANNPQVWNADFTFLGTQNLNMGTGPVTLASSRTLTINAGNLTVGGVIDDAGNNYALTKSGSGILTLAGPNTYIGPTTIGAGTLQIGSGGATGSLSTVSSITDNGVLAFNRSTTVTQGIDFSASPLTGSGGLAQMGTGLLILTASNTYAGTTAVSGGSLQIGNNSAGAAVASTAISLGNSATLIFSPSDTPTYAGTISGAGGVTMNGAGILTLSGTNSFTGALTVSAGTVTVPAGGALNNANGSIFVGSAFFVLSGGSIATGSTGDVKVGYSSAGTMTVSSGTLSVGRNLNIGNPIGAATGVFNQTGGLVTAASPVNLAFQAGAGGGTMNLSGGTFTLAGGNGNLYDGYGASSTFTISGSAYANIPTFNMGRASVGSSVNSPSIVNVLNLDGGTLTTNTIVNNGNGTDTNTVNFDGGVLLASTTSATFLTGMTNANILAGGAIINDGGYTINFAQNLQSGASPDGGLTKLGTGSLILSGTNSYDGGTMVNAGTLVVASQSALLSGSNLTVGLAAASAFTPATPAATGYFSPADSQAAAAGVTAVPEPRALGLLIAGLWGAFLCYWFSSRPKALNPIAVINKHRDRE